MRIYELVLVLKTSLTETQRKKLVEQIKELLKNVKVAKEEEWGQKPLAYKIKRELAGFYHLFHLESDTALEKGFEKRLIANENIIRHLLVRKK
ncbi:MAG: 30S ribosomal protein S6 [Candidatus Levybacteria bacterium]|nr:30S ribosomal protein S6 [Candidatus Levybacteria bacterium]